MSALRNDGTVQYGSAVLAIGVVTAGNPPTVATTTNYVADNISISRPGKTIERTNELDEPSGQVTYAGFVTGSATIQLATSSALVPFHGKGFSLNSGFDPDNDADTDAEVFYIDSVDQPLTKDGERKVNITFRKFYATT
jgi:hypothetical protein